MGFPIWNNFEFLRRKHKRFGIFRPRYDFYVGMQPYSKSGIPFGLGFIPIFITVYRKNKSVICLSADLSCFLVGGKTRPTDRFGHADIFFEQI